MTMRNLVESEGNDIHGGADTPPALYPPNQSAGEIRAILDQLRHINDKPGTY